MLDYSAEIKSRLQRIFAGYRLAVTLLLFGLFQVTHPEQPPSALHALWFWLSLGYVLTGLFSLGWLWRSGRSLSITLFLALDAVVLSLFILTGGESSQGLALLMLVTVVFATLLLNVKLSLLLVLIAISALIYPSLVLPAVDYNQIVLLSLMMLSSWGLILFLMSRLDRTQALNQVQASNIATLEQLNSQIIARMRTGVLVLDHQGRMKHLNQAASVLIFNEQQPPSTRSPLPASLRHAFDRWRQQGMGRHDMVELNRHNQPVQLNFCQVQDNPGSDHLVFIEDSLAMAQQAQQLKLASLGRLTASIAHEIRNPLSAIQQAAELLAEADYLSDSDQRLLQIVHTHCQRVDGIISTIMDLGKQPQQPAQCFQLHELLLPLVDEWRLQAPMLDWQLQLEQPLEVQFDPLALRQVLQNIVGNAIAILAEQANGQILLQSGIANANGQPYLRICDNGPGIDESHQQHVFEPFFSKRAGGTGLGLYICRELCLSNQTQIQLQSSPGQGSCFSLLFCHPGRQF